MSSLNLFFGSSASFNTIPPCAQGVFPEIIDSVLSHGAGQPIDHITESGAVSVTG